MCEKSYGITNVAKNVAFTNALYGGQNPNVSGQRNNCLHPQDQVLTF